MIKKYVGKSGGRYLYNSDLENMQNIGLDILMALFGESGNMVVSGAKINKEESKLTSGFVYINDILREVPETKYSKLPLYIYEKNISENVQYEDDQSKIGRISYTAIVTETKPSDIIDPYTNKLAQFIEISGNEATDRTFQSVFLDKVNGVMLKNSSVAQNINGEILFKNKVTFFGNLIAKYGIDMDGFSINKVGDELIFTSGSTKLLKINKNGNIDIPENKIQIKDGSIYVDKIKVSDIFIENNNIFIKSGELVINRNTDKKNVGFSLFDGIKSIFQYAIKSDFVKFFLKLKVNKEINIIDEDNLKENDTYNPSISLSDREDNKTLTINSVKNVSNIKNAQTDLNIESKNINFKGKVTENGKDISLKYVHKDTYDVDKAKYVISIEGKGLSDTNYTEEEKKKLEAIKTSDIKSADDGYVTSKDVSENISSFVKKENLLSDLNIKEEDDKKKACSNIGAAYKPDVEPKISDTGWIKMTHPTNGELHNLLARQIGNQVWIRGSVNTNSTVNKVYAKLPNKISPPSFTVFTRYNDISSRQGNAGVVVGINKETSNFKELDRTGFNGVTIDICLHYLTN